MEPTAYSPPRGMAAGIPLVGGGSPRVQTVYPAQYSPTTAVPLAQAAVQPAAAYSAVSYVTTPQMAPVTTAFPAQPIQYHTTPQPVQYQFATAQPIQYQAAPQPVQYHAVPQVLVPIAVSPKTQTRLVQAAPAPYALSAPVRELSPARPIETRTASLLQGKVLSERPITREELASTGNLVEVEAQQGYAPRYAEPAFGLPFAAPRYAEPALGLPIAPRLAQTRGDGGGLRSAAARLVPYGGPGLADERLESSFRETTSQYSGTR